MSLYFSLFTLIRKGARCTLQGSKGGQYGTACLLLSVLQPEWLWQAVQYGHFCNEIKSCVIIEFFRGYYHFDLIIFSIHFCNIIFNWSRDHRSNYARNVEAVFSLLILEKSKWVTIIFLNYWKIKAQKQNTTGLTTTRLPQSIMVHFGFPQA